MGENAVGWPESTSGRTAAPLAPWPPLRLGAADITAYLVDNTLLPRADAAVVAAFVIRHQLTLGHALAAYRAWVERRFCLPAGPRASIITYLAECVIATDPPMASV